MTIKDALTSNDLAGAIPEDFVGAVNKNAAKAKDVAHVASKLWKTAGELVGEISRKQVMTPEIEHQIWEAVRLAESAEKSGEYDHETSVRFGALGLTFKHATQEITLSRQKEFLKTAEFAAYRLIMDMRRKEMEKPKNAKFAPGDVAYCRAFACNARVLSVATTKSGICNYKVALYDAKGVRTGEAVCGESDLVRKATRGVKLTTIAQGASRACDTAANILEKMLQRNKVDVPLAKKVVRLTGKDFPDARVQQAAAYLNENPPALASAARVLRAEANRLRAQGKSMKAMRAAVKRVDETTVHLVAPLHSKLLMIYRKFIGNPEATSLGNLPALAAQWKSLMAKLNPEDETGAMLVARDLMSAYRSFAKEQMKNTAYFLAMALGTANRMVGGSDRVPIPAHLRAVKGRNDVATPLEQAQHTLTAMSYLIASATTDDAALRKLLGTFEKFYFHVIIADASAKFSPNFYKQAKPMLANAKQVGAQAESIAGLVRHKPDQRQKMLAEVQDKLNAAGRILSDVGTLWNRIGGKSVKAIDAKEYYDKNKKIPKGSILRVNGKLMEVDTPNGYVISGFEYKKPWSTSTHVSVDLRNTPAMLLSVGTGTIREGRDGNVVFGRRPARNAAKSLTKHFFGYKMYTTQVNEKDSHMAKKAIKPWARKLEPQTYITPQIWGVFKQRSPRTAALVEEAVGADGVTGRQLGNVTNDLRSFGEVDVLRKFTAQIKDWNARLTDPNYGNN